MRGGSSPSRLQHSGPGDGGGLRRGRDLRDAAWRETEVPHPLRESEEAQERSKMENQDRKVMGGPRGRGSPRVMNGRRGERRPGQNPSLRCKLNGTKEEESVGRRPRKNTWKVQVKVKRGK